MPDCAKIQGHCRSFSNKVSLPEVDEEIYESLNVFEEKTCRRLEENSSSVLHSG